jgi:hypothetical protein
MQRAARCSETVSLAVFKAMWNRIVERDQLVSSLVGSC